MTMQTPELGYVAQTLLPIAVSGNVTVRVPPAQRKSRLRVLLVEDDEADIYLIRCALANNPRVAEVIGAHDGVEALELIENGRANPDLAIVDLKMPRKDGLTLLKDFESRTGNTFPTVILTSSRAPGDAHLAKNHGAIKFLTKPDTLGKLSIALDQVISKV